MSKYGVHLFPVVRFTVRGVEAESMEEACKIAEQVLSDETIKSAMCGGSDHEADFGSLRLWSMSRGMNSMNTPVGSAQACW